jgi:hypothetical protein
VCVRERERVSERVPKPPTIKQMNITFFSSLPLPLSISNTHTWFDPKANKQPILKDEINIQKFVFFL